MTSLAERFYEPVRTGFALDYDESSDEDVDFDWSDLSIFAVRPRDHSGRLLGAELRLTERKADMLCDILEEVRRDALNRIGMAA
jgi:hypothetical protein